MAIAFEEALKKNIASGELLPVYILFGEDGYLKKTYSDKITKKITEPDDVFNYCKFGASCDLQEVYDAAMQLPFMADKKCILLDDYDFEHCSKTDLDRLCSLLSEASDSAVIILRFDNLEFDSKKSSKFKRIVASAEKAGGMAVKLDHRKMPELIKMLTDGASKRGCKMDSATAKYLIETAGEDINILRNELDKLCAFSGSTPITRETVDRVCIKTVEASVYNLSKHIIACDISASLTALDELFFMRIEPMIILHSISSVYVDMFRIYTAKSDGGTVSQVSSAFGYKGREFVLEKAATSLKKFDFKRLSLSLEALTAADNSLKSFGADGRIVLEQLIIKLIYIIVKGESVDKA
ncbi:MAG: DNA polymerase III subunit delta [Clostridia bacterium]|nr:DNA polymerase III subunit delta [Clostridia bacterium]